VSKKKDNNVWPEDESSKFKKHKKKQFSQQEKTKNKNIMQKFDCGLQSK